MATKKKQRKAVARAEYQAYLERKTEQAHRRKRRQVVVGVFVAVAIVVGIGVWSVVQGDDASTPPTAEPSASPSTSPTNSPKSYDKPEQVLNPKTPASATLTTNRGDIKIDLDVKNAPKNSNSVAFLAGEGFFDNTSCHRLTTGATLSVLQCGDPTGSGSGNPGYTVADENLPKAGKDNYPAGTVAMAEPQGGEAGSQFFLVYEDTTLPPDYTIVGHISSGLDILRQVAQGGVKGGGNDGAPAKPVTIESVSINQS